VASTSGANSSTAAACWAGSSEMIPETISMRGP